MTSWNPLRLLIVEDDIVDCKLLKRLLGQTSLEVSEMRDTDRLADALQLLRAEAFDIILLDLGLPDSQGMDSVIAVQNHAPQIPIIVLSGFDDEATASRAVHMGVQDYLIKGQVDSSTLVRSIRYALERKKAERELQAAEQRYRTIFENSAVAIMMVDSNERLISWNTFTERLLALSADDLQGRDIRSFYPDQEWQRIRALNIRRKGMQHHLETKMSRGDGQVIDVDISLSIVHDSDGAPAGSIGVIRDITERKRMEDALRKSEKRFRQVVENAREWIWEVDAEGLYTYVSPVVEKILGYHVEEVLGRHHFYDFFHPDEAVELKSRSFEIFRRKDVFSEFTNRNLRKDGTVVWLLRSGVPILGEDGELLGYRGVDTDITDRMRTMEVLDRKQKNLEAIFDAAPLGMLLVSEDMRVVRANEPIRQMSGKAYVDIINEDVCRALSCTGADGRDDGTSAAEHRCAGCSLSEMIGSALASGQAVRGVEIRPRVGEGSDADRPWLSATVELVNIDGLSHALVALNDVTECKRAEEELRRTMELKAQFISTVSHELRTPLTSMKEAVIIVQNGVAGKLSKDQKHFLDIAKRNIDRLGRLIDDVLDFQKLNAGKLEFHMRDSSIVAVVEDAYNTMLPHARKNDVTLAMEVEPELPLVTFDYDRVIQVLQNLVSNAIKFTPQGGRVLVSAHRCDDSIALRITDTGCGIPKQDLSRIFEQFYRVTRPGREIKGTGLGLAIVNRIVAGHGGRIDVESEVDKGTTFSVVLPIRSSADPQKPSDDTDRSLEHLLTE